MRLQISSRDLGQWLENEKKWEQKQEELASGSHLQEEPRMIPKF